MRGAKGQGRGSVVVAAILAMLFVFLPSTAALSDGNGGAKLSSEVDEKIRAAGSDDLLPVIVQTAAEPTSGHLTRLHARGGVMKARHAAFKGYSAKLPASQIAAFADDPEIEHVSYDSPVRAHLDVAYQAVRADVALQETGWLDGRGIGVAVVDTGVTSHPDLLRAKGSPQVVEVEVVGHENGLADYYGHGTHVAGIIAGSGAASGDKLAFRTFKGLAPGAQIVSIRALQPDGSGFTSDVIAAIDWAIRFKANYNIRVLNLSLGHPIFESYRTDPLCRAVRAAHDAGIVVVVAAGNDGAVGSGFGTISSPGNEPTALTVGAMDDGNTVTTGDDVLAWYSSKGPSLIDFVVKPDVVAPGTWIVSARAVGSFIDTAHHDLVLQVGLYRNDPRNATKDGDYLTLAGTSMAAPMVSATAALMLQKDPGLTPATVKARIMRSAVKDDHLMFETGAGYLDVAGALAAGGNAPNASSPTAMLASDGYIYVEETGLIWGGFLGYLDIWSLGAIWGGGKGGAKSISLTDVPDWVTYSYGAIWGGRTGKKDLTENDQVTSSGLIWSGLGCIYTWNVDSVDTFGAIWKGKR